MWRVLWVVLALLMPPSLAFNHWVVTEEGKIEYQMASPFNLRQPFNLLAFMQQEQRVSILRELKDELIEYKNEFEGYTSFENLDASFRAQDPECRNVKFLSAYDLYITTVLPLEHKGIRLMDHLDLSTSSHPGEPVCLGSPLEFSMYALEHLEGVQQRRSLVVPPEKSVLAGIDMRMEVFGSLVHHALEKNTTSWVLLDLATLYWRARGNPFHALECIRRALHYSPQHSLDIPLLNLANILHRSHHSSDAIIPLQVATSVSPTINVLHFTLGNIFAALNRLNESVASFEHSLALEPESDTVRSIHIAALCELKMEAASWERARKLELTQQKLDQFYENMDLLQKHQVSTNGERADNNVQESASRDKLTGETTPQGSSPKLEKKKKKVEHGTPARPITSNESDNMADLDDASSAVDSELTLEQALDDAITQRNETDSFPPEKAKETTENDKGRTLHLVVKPRSRGENYSDSVQQDSDDTKSQSGAHVGLISECPVESALFLTSPAQNICASQHGGTAASSSELSNATGRQSPGRDAHTTHSGHHMRNLNKALDCALSGSSSENCLKTHRDLKQKLHEDEKDEPTNPLTNKHRPRIIVKTIESKRQIPASPKSTRRQERTDSTRAKSDKAKPKPKLKQEVSELKHFEDIILEGDRGDHQWGPDMSEYSFMYRKMEFLPYNPLPAQLGEVMFPDRSSPLALYDDPYWPSKVNCLELIAMLRNMPTLTGFTGTFLTPEARGADITKLFAPVPLSLPSFMRQQPRCTDIVELPYSMAALDHLEPVMHRTSLRVNEQAGEKGLKKVLISTVTGGLGVRFNFEESAQRAYAAMLKNGPNWALFNIASLYWRVIGDSYNAIECLRRAVHFASNSAKDVGYLGLANVLHRQGFLNDAIIAARAALDISGDSPVGHYTLAGVYLSLKDYVATSLHLRTALHAQPEFDHALSALKIVRCSLKFREEQEHLKRKMQRAQEELMKEHEAKIARDIDKVLETVQNTHEAVQFPAVVVKPPKYPDSMPVVNMLPSPFTGEDAIRYLTKLALIRQSKRKSQQLEQKDANDPKLQEVSNGSQPTHKGNTLPPSKEEGNGSQVTETGPEVDVSNTESRANEAAPERDALDASSEAHTPDSIAPEQLNSNDEQDESTSERQDGRKETDSLTTETTEEVDDAVLSATAATSQSETESEVASEQPSSDAIREESSHLEFDSQTISSTSETGKEIEQSVDVISEEPAPLEFVSESSPDGDSQMSSSTIGTSETQEEELGLSSDAISEESSSEFVSDSILDSDSQRNSTTDGKDTLNDKQESESADKTQSDSNPKRKKRKKARKTGSSSRREEEQLMARIREEIDRELEDILAQSAEIISKNMSPVPRTAPAKVIPPPDQRGNIQNKHKPQPKPASNPVSKASPDEEDPDQSLESVREESDPKPRRVSRKSKTREDIREEEIKKRFPGHRPWPSVEECRGKPLPKYIIFTSTWLSVTAKGVNVKEHIDFESPVEHYPLLPYCQNDFSNSPKTLDHLQGMQGPPLVKEYRAERGLQEVLCNLDSTHRSLNEMATRLKLAMDRNSSSWVLSNLAALYWRIVGQGRLAVSCLRHSLYYSDHNTKDVALVSLANVFYRLGYSRDAVAVMHMSLEAAPTLVVNHFTMANILAAQGFWSDAAGFYESTLQYQPEFQPAADRLWTVRCHILLATAARENM